MSTKKYSHQSAKSAKNVKTAKLSPNPDKGVSVTSATWAGWCGDCGVQHITTTAFHPQGNGMVERLHRQMKDALHARGNTAAWADHLPWVMLGI